MNIETGIVARRHDERGMTTAEYAVGTVATVSFVGVILAIIKSSEFQNMLMGIVNAVINMIVQAIGGGN